MSAWLIDTVLYTGLLIGLVLMLRRPVGKFFGPQLAYSLWALPFLRLLLPPIVLPASLAPEPAQVPATTATEAMTATIEAPTETAAAPLDFAATAPPAWEWADLIAPAVSTWAGVALAFLAFRVVTYRRMRRELLRGARPVGEIGRVRMVETPALAAPVAFGVFDKVIALPPLFMAQPDLAARDLAIAHELAHHKGHDLLANMAAQALLALHWFNPIAWYGWRAMRRDQEAACDARVLAGRGREERLTYAALIAGIATGPRSIAFERALAAPMACPVLGERSIVHRLRSISMSEMSRRRRWFGRGLFAAGALALPLTASISYASASAQPAAPDPPAAPSAVSPPLPPAPPAAPEAFQAEGDEAHSLTQDHHSDLRFALSELPEPPQPPEPPEPPQFHAQGAWNSEEFQAEMEEFQREMERFRQEFDSREWEEFGEQMARWSEQYGEEMARWGEQHAARMQTHAEQVQRQMPDVQRIVRSSLRQARAAVARDPELSNEERTEALRELDQEIERLDREGN
jgi:bla regulator protein BlaR1